MVIFQVNLDYMVVPLILRGVISVNNSCDVRHKNHSHDLNIHQILLEEMLV